MYLNRRVFVMEFLVFNANSVDPDQTPHFAASDVGLCTVCQCPFVSPFKDRPFRQKSVGFPGT